MKIPLAWRGAARPLAFAACLHLAATLAVYVAGSRALAPGLIDANGIMEISDSSIYRAEVVHLVRELQDFNIASWARAPFPVHVKLYSVSFALFHTLTGFTILSAEPLNLLFYLSILALVFMLGREIFDARTGFLAAAIVALWPSFLFHTTQLLRDPLFILLLLTFVFVNVRLLTRDYSFSRGALVGLSGAAVCALLWLTRAQMWSVFVAMAFLGAALFVVRQFAERRILKGNLLGVAAGLAMIVSVPFVVGRFQPPDLALPKPLIVDGVVQPARTRPVTDEAENPVENPSSVGSPLSEFVALVRAKRAHFLDYSEGGTNIDEDLRLNNLRDVLFYLPRAVELGLFAPFPSMWLDEGGRVGQGARILTGLETLLIYVLELMAVVAVWKKRRHPSVWFLLLTVITSAAALGLVVVNVGALYRMRYAFWMLLVVLGADGVRQLVSSRVSTRRPILEESVSLNFN